MSKCILSQVLVGDERGISLVLFIMLHAICFHHMVFNSEIFLPHVVSNFPRPTIIIEYIDRKD